MIDLVICDDHPIVLDGLEGILTREPGFRVVARCNNGLEAISAVRKFQPHVLLLDVNMPEMDGFGVLAALKREGLNVLTILLTASLDARRLAEGTQAGAAAVILKERVSRDVVETVKRVQRGERGIGVARRVTPMSIPTQDEATGLSALTERELELASLVARGLRNKEIAQMTGIAEGTVKIHLHSAYKKLGVDSRTELTIRLRALGM